MTHYYAHQTRRWLTEDEQGKFHIDYEPQSTKGLAILECRKFLQGRLRLQLSIFDSWLTEIDAMTTLEREGRDSGDLLGQ